MAVFASNEMAITLDVPFRPAGNEALGGRKRLFRATIPLDAPKLNSGSAGTVVTTADTVKLGTIPPGLRFVCGRITSTVSLGTSTVAIGVAGTTGKYRAAAVFTAVDTPTLFGTAAAMAADPLGAADDLILTVAVANLPTTASAKLVIDMEFVGP